MITLPIHLTLEHVLAAGLIIQATVQKSSLQSLIQEDQINQTQQMLRMISSDEQQFYEDQFIRAFCLIKINSLLAEQCNINKQFIDEFINFYNSKQQISVRISKSDDQLFSQVILQTHLYQYIHIHDIQNVLGGQCLLAASLVLIIRKTQTFLKKAEISFALSFLALSGRYQAFISHVHKQKNHEGQIKFAQIIFQYIKIDQPTKYSRIDVQVRKVQDPYSMRCSPQVYGVVYDCLSNLKNNIESILNKFHFRKLIIEGDEYPNLDISADSQTLKGDFLVCSMNQIGSMAFLRSERILNIYLGKNQLYKQNPKKIFQLKTRLDKIIHLCAENKLICAPSNGDTMNIDNYEKDVYFISSKVHQKFTKMQHNLYKIMQLQIQTAILGLNNVYNINKGEIFLNQTIKAEFFNLQSVVNNLNRKQALKFISNQWKV